MLFSSDSAGVGLFLRLPEERTPSQLRPLPEEERRLRSHAGAEIKSPPAAGATAGGLAWTSKGTNPNWGGSGAFTASVWYDVNCKEVPTRYMNTLSCRDVTAMCRSTHFPPTNPTTTVLCVPFLKRSYFEASLAPRACGQHGGRSEVTRLTRVIFCFGSCWPLTHSKASRGRGLLMYIILIWVLYTNIFLLFSPAV